jgi:hypothetical protein
MSSTRLKKEMLVMRKKVKTLQMARDQIKTKHLSSLSLEITSLIKSKHRVRRTSVILRITMLLMKTKMIPKKATKLKLVTMRLRKRRNLLEPMILTENISSMR